MWQISCATQTQDQLAQTLPEPSFAAPAAEVQNAVPPGLTRSELKLTFTNSRIVTWLQESLPGRRLASKAAIISVSPTSPAMEATTSERVSELDGSAPESTDYANYFCTYAYLYHQVCIARARSHIHHDSARG